MFNRIRPILRPATAAPRGRARAAFTLTELIAAVAIVVVLMLGVSYVFTATSDTIGVGMAMSTVTRQARATQTTLAEDFDRAMAQTGTEPMPSLVINGQRNNLQAAAYANKADLDAGVTGQFRTDTLSLFASGTFQRLTADDGWLSSAATAQQAWIHFGHLEVTDGSVTGFVAPGVGTAATNRNNFYANQWTVGRFVMLLRGDVVGATSPDARYVLQPGATSTAPLAPVGYGSYANDTADPPTSGTRVHTSRYDQGQWDATTYADGITATGASWWMRLVQTASAPPFATYRFQYDALPMRPLTSASASKTVPAFIANATDFIVEFAGDFQAPAGIDMHTPTSPTHPLSGTATVRWFGFPRDIDGDGLIDAVNDVTPVSNGSAPAVFEHVMPSTAAYATAATPLPPPAAGTRYVAAWHAAMPAAVPRPSLIRITVITADPNGRMAEPQTMQFVFNLK